RGHVLVLVRRVGNGQDDVDDRLRDEAGDRRRARMLDQQAPHAERGTDPLRLALESRWPRVVVVHELDRTVVPRPLVDRHSGQDVRTDSYSPGQSLYATRGASVSSGVDAP